MPQSTKSLKVAVQMDPIDIIKPSVDSTFLLMLEAQARDYPLFYYTPDKLSYDGVTLTARGHYVRVYDDPDNYYTLEDETVVNLSTMDVLLMRQDPPFDMTYITATYLLETIKDQVFMVNDPTSVRDCSEKLWALTEFADLMPPTLVSRDIQTIEDFSDQHGDIIIKPLYLNDGSDVTLITSNSPSFQNDVLPILSETSMPIMAQAYIPEISKGDKRIVLYDGDPIDAVLRVPQQDQYLANLTIGGQATKTTLSKRDIEICDRLKPKLREKNIFFAGIDIIGDYLIEINNTSPSGLRYINQVNKTYPEKVFWDRLERKLTS